MSSDAGGQHAGPNYDVQVDVDELLADLAEMSAEYAHEYVRHDEQWRESLDSGLEPFHDAKYWSLEDLGGRRAIARAMCLLQPDAKFGRESRLVDDGDVDVREFMSWLLDRSEETNEARNGRYQDTRQVSEAHSAYADVLSLLRDDYGVGYPRFDDLGGVLEEDKP